MAIETTIPTRRGQPARLALLASVPFMILACGEAEAPPNGGESEAPEVASEVEGVFVEIDMDEYTILMDVTLPRGPVTLNLANKGFEEHNLLFVLAESDSTVLEIERRLAPGERRTVTFDFEPGEYRAVCNFSGHEDRGMFTTFVVRERTSS